MPTEDTKFQILSDHYKDSFSYLQKFLKQRDIFFFLILIVVTLMLFQIYSPADSGKAISQFVTNELELEDSIDISFIGSIIWFLLLSFVVRYFQTVVFIERQYNYIHKIEDQLSPFYNNDVFTREGKSYLSNYPLFSKWVSILYTIIFPFLLLVVMSTKITTEINNITNGSQLVYINIIIFICIFMSTILYLLLVHFEK